MIIHQLFVIICVMPVYTQILPEYTAGCHSRISQWYHATLAKTTHNTKNYSKSTHSLMTHSSEQLATANR